MAPLLIVLIGFHIALEPYIKSDILFYLTGAPIVLIGIGGALRLFDRSHLLVYEGKLRFDQGMFDLELKRKRKSFRAVEEMVGWTAGWYGFTKCFCLQLKTDAGKIKLISAPLKKGEKFSESEPAKLIALIAQHAPDLKNRSEEEESIWEYWYVRSDKNGDQQ